MTPEQEQGNRKIAELLGWKYTIGLEKQPLVIHPVLGYTPAIFHSDSNWQDRVLKKISELGYSWNINYYSSYNAYQAEIYSQKHGLLLGEVKISGDSKPEVVFELLCKFCDYINQKEK